MKPHKILPNGKQIFRHLCPIGRKNPDKKHFHESDYAFRFEHQDLKHSNGAVTGSFWKEKDRKGRMVTYLMAVSIHALGTVGTKHRYTEEEVYTALVAKAKRILREGRMVKGRQK